MMRRRWRLLDGASPDVELFNRLTRAGARATRRALGYSGRRARAEAVYARHLERQARRVRRRIPPLGVLTFEAPAPGVGPDPYLFVGPRGTL